MTVVARERFSARLTTPDGWETIRVEVGDRFDDDHPFVERWPLRFRSMTGAEQQAIRTERLRELRRREAEMLGRSGSFASAPRYVREEASEVFWRGVDALLLDAYPHLRRQREQDEAGARLMDDLDASRTHMMAAQRETLEELGGWRPAAGERLGDWLEGG